MLSYTKYFACGFMILMTGILTAKNQQDTPKRVYTFKSLQNPKIKNTALYDVRFKKHFFPLIGNITISFGVTHRSGKTETYTERETPSGTEVKYEREICNSKTNEVVAKEEITLLLAYDTITLSNKVTMLKDMKCRQHVSVLLGTTLCYLNTHSLIGAGVMGERDGKIMTGMIPKTFNIKPQWHMTGWYKMYRICGKNETLIFKAGQNAQIWITGAHNNSMEIYSALDAKNPHNRPMTLKKGEVFEWTSSFTMESN